MPRRDEVLYELIQNARKQLASEERSGSDRLRPPYSTPLKNLRPSHAGDQRTLEVGFKNLPYPYQKLLESTDMPPTDFGEMPEGYNVSGITTYPNSENYPNTVLSSSPRNAQHELVHVAGNYTKEPWWPKRGDASPGTEEVLAQVRGGTRRLEESPSATELDKRIREKYPESSKGFLPMLLQYLWGK